MISTLVTEFAEAMLAKMEAKRAVYGDTWKSVDLSVLVVALEEHMAKAKARGRKQDYVDVANFAMFIWSRLPD